MGSKSAGKADTISLAGIFLTTLDSKSVTMAEKPEEVYIVYTVQNVHCVY